jgi:alpha-L-fucosidase
MKYRLFLFSALTAMVMQCNTIHAQYTIPSKLNWWYESRFGMFIHFGSYSYLGHGEWAFSTENWTKSQYQTQVSSHFNPSSFNAGTIARLAKNAGMKYLVITAKHHEGFCMWPTGVQSFRDVTGTKIYDLQDFTSFGSRDILKELKDSCDAVGVKFCLYYSILDWNHSSQTLKHDPVNNWDVFSVMASDSAREAYINDMKTQLRELIDRYHPYVLWFDGDWTYNTGEPTAFDWWTKNDGIDLYDTLTTVDTNLVVNERVFRGSGLGDFECPEQTVPEAPLSRPWETCQTMNNSWGYASWDNNYKTPKVLIQQLVDVVSKDGNYLLNIGPKGDGTLTTQTTDILNNFAVWMKTYSESIYSTMRSPFSAVPVWGRYTRKDGRLYIHVFDWPGNGMLKVPSLANAINRIYLLNDTNTNLNYSDSAGYIRIEVPFVAPDAINSVVVLDVNGLPVASKEYIKTTRITVKGENGVKAIQIPGGTLQLTAAISPSNVTDHTVTWSVSDTSLGLIDDNGLLKAKKDGSITVYSTANDGSDVQGTLAVTISNQTSLVEETGHETTVVIFPNPLQNEMLHISRNIDSEVDVAIYNLLGQRMLIKRMKGEHLSLDLASLDPGTYMVSLSSRDSETMRRLIHL